MFFCWSNLDLPKKTWEDTDHCNLQPIETFGCEAAEWFLKAAEQGDKDGTACPVSVEAAFFEHDTRFWIPSAYLAYFPSRQSLLAVDCDRKLQHLFSLWQSRQWNISHSWYVFPISRPICRGFPMFDSRKLRTLRYTMMPGNLTWACCWSLEMEQRGSNSTKERPLRGAAVRFHRICRRARCGWKRCCPEMAHGGSAAQCKMAVLWGRCRDVAP